MYAGGLDATYRSMLAYGARVSSRIEVWRSGSRIDTYGSLGLPKYGGSIAATLMSQVARQMSVATDGALFPDDVDDLLAPWGNELRVYHLVQAGAGVPYEFPTFRGRINDVSLNDEGDLLLQCIDRGGDVNDSQFSVPENANVGATVTSEFRRLVSEGVLDAEFGDFDFITEVTPTLTWEWDRGSACDDLAAAGNAFWYALANGDYVMRYIPWTIDQEPLLTLTQGEGGVLTSAVPSLSRENVYNVVTVVGERGDGETPVWSVLADNDPASPTYVDGGFGRKGKLINLQTVVTQGQAQILARAALRQAKSLSRSWDLALPIDPSIELGDCFSIVARGLGPDVQVAHQFQLPLLGSETMTMSTRALQPINAQVEEV
jgi:hypothetical protein